MQSEHDNAKLKLQEKKDSIYNAKREFRDSQFNANREIRDNLLNIHKDSLERESRKEAMNLAILQILHQDTNIGKSQTFELNNSKKREELKACRDADKLIHDIECFLGWGFDGCLDFTLEEFRAKKRDLGLLIKSMPPLVGAEVSIAGTFFILNLEEYEQCLQLKLNDNDTLPNLSPPTTRRQIKLKLLDEWMKLRFALTKHLIDLTQSN